MLEKIDNDLNWNYLHYFWVVGQNKSIKRAAQALGLSSSTLSEAIQNLESELQCKLFVRTTRRLDFTTIGASLFDKVSPIFENQGEILRALKGTHIPTVNINFGLVPTNSLPLLFDVIFDILNYKASQRFTVRSCESDQLEALLDRGDVDIGITNRLVQKRNVGCVKIYDCKTKFFVHKGLADENLSTLLRTCHLGLLGSNKMNDDIQSHFLKTFGADRVRFFVTDYISLLFEACLNKKAIIAISADQNFNLSGQLVSISDSQIQKLEFSDEQYFVWSTRIEGSQMFKYVSEQIAKLSHRDELVPSVPIVEI